MARKSRAGRTELFGADVEVVGVVPAAGRSRRLGPLPCSKELFPIGFTAADKSRHSGPKVISQYLLESFRLAGIEKAYVVIREGKWDIPQYFADGRSLAMDLAYVVIRDSSGPPDSVNRAYPFVAGKTVAFGFPDILLQPPDIFNRLLHHAKQRSCDLVLGLLPAHDCRAMDMVEADQRGRVRALWLKPRRTSLRYAWVCAIWGPTFTEFLHDALPPGGGVGRLIGSGNRKIDAQGDVPVGAVIQAAVRQGLSVESVTFPRGSYLDIGTPADLRKAVRTYR